MARVKRGVTARRRHKKILSQAKGYYNARRKVFRVAKQAVTKAQQYAYIGRKLKKRQFRSLWIARINAASRMYGLSYSRFMNGLLKAGITLDRKVLADIAAHDIKGFGDLAEAAGKALNIEITRPANLPNFVPAEKPKAKKGDAKKGAKAAAPAAKAEKAAPAAKKAPAKKAAKGDDLKLIEGVGPKIAEVLTEAGIASFQDLANTDAAKLREILDAAGSQFASHDPTTWPQQAELAATGKMDELKALQDELQGGREVE
ncbi:ribosomal protein L20 [Solilutibacter tolerans]|uniref:Large ribosomal subunit protein bL20 n=1 Tax=Solilutibacter tolerans TaxID=1604334 RepID=A0A1N6NTE2_9GAMM|nr:ribosomal protein L20 [Lysobacter tolerans]